MAVLAGGCSGFQYKFDLDANPAPDDLVIEREGATVLVDPASLDLLAGAELDYVDKLMGSYFAVTQPKCHQRLRLTAPASPSTERRTDAHRHVERQRRSRA